jgi:hypothetical protein
MTRVGGGRGHKAPYKSTHVRVPEPIKDKVEKLIDEYKASLTDEFQAGGLDDNQGLPDSQADIDWNMVMKGVNKFIKEENLEEKIEEPKRYVRVALLTKLRGFIDREIRQTKLFS